MKKLFLFLFMFFACVSVSLEKIFTTIRIELEEELEELNKGALEHGLALSFRKIGDSKEIEAIIELGETVLIIPHEMLESVYNNLNLRDESENKTATVRIYDIPSAEEIDELKKKLDLYPDPFDQQLIILDFFCTRYALSQLQN